MKNLKIDRIKDVLFHVSSVIFIGIIMGLYFYFTFFEGNILLIDNYNNITVYNKSLHNSCHIVITEPSIFLRLDDVRANSYPTSFLVNEVLNRNISITLGVIPYNLKNDLKTRKYLINIKANPLIEIAQHGVYHNSSDLNLSREEMIKGIMEIQKDVGVRPTTYIPPYNILDNKERKIIEKDFNVISSGKNVLKEGSIAELSQTIETYYYNTNEIVSVDKIVETCKENIQKYNFCVVTIHPQEYSSNLSNPIDLSDTNFERFKDMLNYLEQLNASFKTFTDVVTCSN